ncbi:hypothetical protein CCACVL1_02792 [Corchorus capsularis]|uniref:Uncharacterized protein n=1 Tax=Corchorus capsularis TaxID=210143 RepID=A0A1R3K5X2_COCAP|nr:hypothetical protein CCACVL1_02792 [Corchorus capsularis]
MASKQGDPAMAPPFEAKFPNILIITG